MRSKLSITFAIALSIFFFAVSATQGQSDALIKRGSIETASGIRFSVWLNHQLIKQNQSTKLNFSVENRSPRTIYLAWSENNLSTVMDCNFNLHIYPSQMEGDLGHSETKFKFIKVGKGKVYKGELAIPITAYPNSDTYSIAISLGYVTDITGLKRHFGEDPIRFNALFESRIKYFELGGLTVDVEK
jgi:hypothetical protein